LDVHRDFCEVALVEAGEVRSAGRIETTPAALELFAQSLCSTDRVVLEVTGNAWEIARILEPHVGQVLVVHPGDTGIRQARAKTDRLDARALAKLLAAGSLDGLWMPDEQTRALRRRLARRSQLVRARTRAKNECHAVLVRRLIAKPAVSDLFGLAGRQWLRELELPVEERETVDGCLRQIEFLDHEVAELDKAIAKDALRSPEIRRLMTVPGVNVIVAATFLAAVGDIGRFHSPRQLVGYLGLDPRVRQSGSAPATHGRISKQGSAPVRHALVEASWSAVRQPGPLHAFYHSSRTGEGGADCVQGDTGSAISSVSGAAGSTPPFMPWRCTASARAAPCQSRFRFLPRSHGGRVARPATAVAGCENMSPRATPSGVPLRAEHEPAMTAALLLYASALGGGGPPGAIERASVEDAG
jgi:transposase